MSRHGGFKIYFKRKDFEGFLKKLASNCEELNRDGQETSADPSSDKSELETYRLSGFKVPIDDHFERYLQECEENYEDNTVTENHLTLGTVYLDMYVTIGIKYVLASIVAPIGALTDLIFASAAIRNSVLKLAQDANTVGIVMDDDSNSYCGTFYSILNPDKALKVPEELLFNAKVDELAERIIALKTLD